jgi:predicted site-specific integrase-resolvase
MKHTLGTAAKATGVARSTVLNAIKSGKISADKDANGNYAIDPAELHRVYPPLAEKQRIEQERKLSATPLEPLTEQVETAVLVEKVKGLEALLMEKDETLKDLRNRLDQTEQARQEADQERREAQRQLTDQRAKPEPAEPVRKKRWWQ